MLVMDGAVISDHDRTRLDVRQEIHLNPLHKVLRGDAALANGKASVWEKAVDVARREHRVAEPTAECSLDPRFLTAESPPFEATAIRVILMHFINKHQFFNGDLSQLVEETGPLHRVALDCNFYQHFVSVALAMQRPPDRGQPP